MKRSFNTFQYKENKKIKDQVIINNQATKDFALDIITPITPYIEENSPAPLFENLDLRWKINYPHSEAIEYIGENLMRNAHPEEDTPEPF